MKESLFHKLLWIYITLNIAAVIASLFPNYSPQLTAAYDNEPASWQIESTWALITLLMLVLGIWIASIIGLFLFKRWGRSLALYSSIAGVIVMPLFGPLLYSGIESAFYEASAMLWGAILALAYFSPISDRFTQNPAAKINN